MTERTPAADGIREPSAGPLSWRESWKYNPAAISRSAPTHTMTVRILRFRDARAAHCLLR
jgi:hypothetical protein